MNRQDYLDGKISHDEYYRGLAKEHHIAISENNLRLFDLKSIDDLKRKYAKDEHLNNIPMRIFDGMTVSYNAYNPHTRLTLADGTCIYKSLLKQLIEG